MRLTLKHCCKVNVPYPRPSIRQSFIQLSSRSAFHLLKVKQHALTMRHADELLKSSSPSLVVNAKSLFDRYQMGN